MRKLVAVYENGNHRVIICNDGTKIKETLDPNVDHFTYDFAENADIKITDYCTVGCPYCHEASSPNGKHADLKSMVPLFNTLHAGTELAIGGGNILDHPDIEWFLNFLKSKKVIANITVNQKSLSPEAIRTIKSWIDRKLVNGVGISLTDSKNLDKAAIDKLGPNVVLHIIAGIFNYKDFYSGAIDNRKILILGYKDLRRGHDFLSKPWMSGPGNLDNLIKQNIHYLKKMLPAIKEKTKSISFDCLAIDQLDPKSIFNMSDEDYTLRFQGSDTDVLDNNGDITCSTFYIDAVTKTCARMSTAALDKRFKVTEEDTIESLFKKSIQGW